ncbi:hypothetical protein [Brucella anthropi]|nr:hypothetical protein [Ochrobactrum sp. MYb49]
MSKAISVIDYAKIGTKGRPIHYEALGISPPMKLITIEDEELSTEMARFI